MRRGNVRGRLLRLEASAGLGWSAEAERAYNELRTAAQRFEAMISRDAGPPNVEALTPEQRANVEEYSRAVKEAIARQIEGDPATRRWYALAERGRLQRAAHGY